MSFLPKCNKFYFNEHNYFLPAKSSCINQLGILIFLRILQLFDLSYNQLFS